MHLGLAISWANPAWFLLLLLLPATWWIRSRRGDAALRFAPTALATQQAVRSTWRERLRFVPWLVRAAAWSCCIAALAQPTSRVELPRTTLGIDVLLCVDVSSSMAARDMAARDGAARDGAAATNAEETRLEVAKDAATRFVASRPQDRVGLVTFAAYADMISPLTLDHTAIARQLNDIKLVDRDGPEDLTGIGNAVARAASILSSSEAASRVIVLLSDGEENVAHADAPTEIGPAQAAGMAREFGVRVYTIAAGRGNPGPDGGFTPLDTRAVEQLAKATDGAFFRAEDEQAVGDVFLAIDELEKSPLADPQYRTDSLHARLLWIAMGLLLFSLLLQRTTLQVRP